MDGTTTLGDANNGVSVEALIRLKERAEHGAHDADRGQIWTKSTNPMTLWFTDGEGTDTQIA